MANGDSYHESCHEPEKPEPEKPYVYGCGKCPGCEEEREDVEFKTDMGEGDVHVCADCYEVWEEEEEDEEEDEEEEEECAPEDGKCDKCYKALTGGDNNKWGHEQGEYKSLCDLCYDKQKDEALLDGDGFVICGRCNKGGGECDGECDEEEEEED
jgi:hypothetical protein